MKSYTPDSRELAGLVSGSIKLLIFPIKSAPISRKKGSLLQGLPGLWIAHKKVTYRVTAPQSKHIANACPLGPPEDIARVKERIELTGNGVWVYEIDQKPVELPPGDHRISAMLSWAHHADVDECPAHRMPSWAQRIELLVTRASLKQVLDLSEEDAMQAGCANLETLWAWLTRFGAKVVEQNSWMWIVGVVPGPVGGATCT